MTSAALRQQRIRIYKKHVKYNHYQIFPCLSGRSLQSAAPTNRKKNFIRFVDLYFSKAKPPVLQAPNDPFADKPQPGGLKKSSKAYYYFDRFSQTDYGSSVIKEMLDNHRKYKGFLVVQGLGAETQSAYGAIKFGSEFPQPRFKFGNQIILPEAIIYHEFGHTKVFFPKEIVQHRDLKHECEVVRKLENPVRLRAGLEPRYTYTDRMAGLRTINIITGEEKNGAFAVDKNDPRKLVLPGSQNAIRI